MAKPHGESHSVAASSGFADLYFSPSHTNGDYIDLPSLLSEDPGFQCLADLDVSSPSHLQYAFDHGTTIESLSSQPTSGSPSTIDAIKPTIVELHSDAQPAISSAPTTTKSKSSECSVCFVDFQTAKGLDEHAKDSTHRTYKCPHPGCPKRYHRLDCRSRHKQTHTRVEDRSCPLCHQMFKRRDHLERHLHQCRQSLRSISEDREPSKPTAEQLRPRLVVRHHPPELDRAASPADHTLSTRWLNPPRELHDKQAAMSDGMTMHPHSNIDTGEVTSDQSDELDDLALLEALANRVMRRRRARAAALDRLGIRSIGP